MKTILKQTQNVVTVDGEYRLVYELLQSQFPHDEREGEFFGIRIQQYGRQKDIAIDHCEATGVTENYGAAVQLFQVFVQEKVMPVHLYEILDDLQSAFTLSR